MRWVNCASLRSIFSDVAIFLDRSLYSSQSITDVVKDFSSSHVITCAKNWDISSLRLVLLWRLVCILGAKALAYCFEAPAQWRVCFHQRWMSEIAYMGNITPSDFPLSCVPLIAVRANEFLLRMYANIDLPCRYCTYFPLIFHKVQLYVCKFHTIRDGVGRRTFRNDAAAAETF